MRVSQLRLPDPLEERDDGEDQQSQSMGGAESGHRQLVDDYSDCGLSDIDLDRMSLPSSTGLSQLSVVDDTGDDDFSDEKLRPAKGRLEMSVASTRLSGAAPEDGLQKPHETRSTSDNTNCDIRDGYSIISHLDGCRSPSYSITGVRTPPPPPLRSPSFVVGQVNLDGTQSSLPRNLKEYIDGLSATEKQNNRQDEHQKNFEMWLKSVTPYSQRTMDSDDVSSMSSLASPLRVPSTHSSHILQGKKQTTNPTAQSLYERYARLRQSSAVPIAQNKPIAQDHSSPGLHSMLTLHSSDVSVRVPAVTDSPGSARGPQTNDPTRPSLPSTPLSNSYTAALETIEQLCDTADESESLVDQALSSSADQSFKTALTSLDKASSARLVISRDYDAGDELTSFGSSSGDSAWETEESSESEESKSASSRRSRNRQSRTRRSSWRSFMRFLIPSVPSRDPFKAGGDSSWWRYSLGSLLLLAISVVIGAYLVPDAPAPYSQAQSETHVSYDQEREKPYDIHDFMALFDPSSSSAPAPVASTGPSQLVEPEQILSPESLPAATPVQSSVLVLNHAGTTGWLSSAWNDALEYLYILAIFVTTAYIFKYVLSRVGSVVFKPKPPSSGLRYLPGRKIVIRPARESSEVVSEEPKPSIKERERGSSIDFPIELESENDDRSDGMASSCSSIVTVVPAQAKPATRQQAAAEDTDISSKMRAASTPAKKVNKSDSEGRQTRASTMSPPGSDRVLRSHARLQRASVEPEVRQPPPTLSMPSVKGKERRTTPEPVAEPTKTSVRQSDRATTAPAPVRMAGGEHRKTRTVQVKAMSVPARDRQNESFHLCFIHGSAGVGKASLMQRAKRGTYFDPEHPVYPGPESIEEFKHLKGIKHMHFEKGDKLTTLVFGYGRMFDQPESEEAKRWMNANRIYMLRDVGKSKVSKRGRNVHVILYTFDDKASQKEAVTIAAQMLAEEPDSQVAMVMTKCDKTKSERTLDASQTQVHSALKQVTDSLDDVIYYRTSARTRRGVDELFRDIARKLRKDNEHVMETSQTLPMDLD